MTVSPHRPVVCITQARLNSWRLPRKVLLPIEGEPLLWWHLTRLQRAKLVDRIVVATTNEPDAGAIAAIAHRLGIEVFHGSETDVLSRFEGAAAMAGAATVVRVTSDCPLIDPVLLDEVVAGYFAAGTQYYSLNVSTYPRGLDCEVFSRRSLDEAAREAVEQEEREHVTPFIRRRPERYQPRFHSAAVPARPHRWCVDVPADFELVSRIIRHLVPVKPDFGWRDVAELVETHPDWAEINAAVPQTAIA